MADLELSIRYRSLPNRVGFTVMCCLLPFWALFVPMLLGFFISYMLSYPYALAPHIMVAILCLLSSIPILAVIMTALFEDDRLHVSKDGISFPLFMLPFLGFRRNRAWSELVYAGVRRDHQRRIGENDTLVLKFTERGLPIMLGTRAMEKQHLEQLLLAMELWGASGARTPDLVTLQHCLQNENVGIDRISSTHLWEEELSRRFNATTFVPLEPGKLLRGGSLKIIRQVAFGGFSAIYLAQRDERDFVILKESIVPPNSDAESKRTAQEHFEREARFLMSLDHPSIVRVTDYFVENDRHYLLLQYVGGQDLRQYVKEHGPQPESRVLQWAVEICSILEYIHTRIPPIIHRDLTPDNLVLRNDGSIMLIDFGAANEFVGTATGTLVGKQAYMAPEQVRGKATLASDLYSFGGTLFYLLTGRDPVPLSVSRPKAVLPDISTELDELVAQLTAMEPQDRPPSTPAVLTRLQALSGSTGTADPPALVGGSGE